MVLLAPSATLLSVWDDFALDFHVIFNASKSKCVIFPPTGGKYRFTIPDPVFFRIGDSVIEITKLHVATPWALADEWSEQLMLLVYKARRHNCFEGQTNNLLCQIFNSEFACSK
jgi:hypothetical protein